jgi:hypothetical protein
MNEGEQGICITESRVQDKALLHFLGRGEQGKALGARGRPRREHQEAPAPGGGGDRLTTSTRRQRHQKGWQLRARRAGVRQQEAAEGEQRSYAVELGAGVGFTVTLMGYESRPAFHKLLNFSSGNKQSSGPVS